MSWKRKFKYFPGGAVVKNPPANAGDTGSSSWSGKIPTCRRATKHVNHNYWACALESVSHNYWACVPQLLKPARLESMLCNKREDTASTTMKSSPRLPQLEKGCVQQQRPNAAKNK